MLVKGAGRHGGEQGEQFLICPYCRREGLEMEDYVHPVGVRVYPVNGITEVMVAHDGAEIRPTDAAETQRGASVVLRFRCEGAHDWESELRFHRGKTIVEDTKLPDYDMESEEGPLTLWRI